jgi:selenide, water dikinase
VRLSRSEMNVRGGCQCKLPGADLATLLTGAFATASGILKGMPLSVPRGDCALLEVDAPRLLISTDMTPLVGVDLVVAGRIAALHAMSDIFAAGGTPRWALATLITETGAPLEHAEAVMVGMLLECGRHGVGIVGGQTITGPEPAAGLTIVGLPPSVASCPRPGAIAGDMLMLSKPIGVGLILRGYKLGLIGEEALDAAVATMTQSNAEAGAAATLAGVNACTDVSGFGLLGHLADVLGPTNGAVVELSSVPVLSEVASLPPHVGRTMWSEANREYAAYRRRVCGTVSPEAAQVLSDPQTNGGLLVSVRAETAPRLERAGFVVIGRVTADDAIELRP